MKRTFFHGIVAALFAAPASLIYNKVYSTALMVDFSPVINNVSIIAASTFGCLVASVGYYFFSKWVKNKTDVWFNIIFLLLTFATLVASFSITLPLTVQNPELFAGLSVPMHIFPCLFWLATKPLFNQSETK